MVSASTKSPTYNPTLWPSANPSMTPSAQPAPTRTPTDIPSSAPTLLIYDDDEQGIASDENVDHSASPGNEAARNAMKLIRAQVMPSMPVHVICLLLVLLFFFLLLHNLFGRTNSAKKAGRKPVQKIQKSVKITVIVTFIANLIGITSMLAMTTIMVTAEQWDLGTFKKSTVAYSFVSVGYIVGKASMEMFYIFRVYNAFRDSALAMSTCTVACLLFFLTIIALIWLFSLVIDQRQWTVFDRDYDYLILSSLDTVLVSVLLTLFVKKLNSLVLMQKSECIAEASTVASQSSMSRQPTITQPTITPATKTQPTMPSIHHMRDTTEVEMYRVVKRAVTVDSVQRSLNQRQTRVITVMTRCIVLNVVAFVTTIMFGFFAFYYVRYGTHLYFLYSAWSLDMLINSTCLYLNFVFAGDLYSKCCGCCHSRCQKLMEYCAAKQILHEHENETKAVSINPSNENKQYHE
mmetsp:Transcript_16900/g.26245  ORF Transcript_16900/g.26245 Transcript_16900/m.26245 type:complete len:462 (-) Transcript_16900:94-1479(-)